MLRRVLSLSLAAALLLVVGAVLAADKPAAAADDTHSGTFVSFSNGKLVMTDDKGKEMTHTVAKDAKVTIDNKPVKVDDLATLTKGAPVIVTLDKDTATALKIDAKSK